VATWNCRNTSLTIIFPSIYKPLKAGISAVKVHVQFKPFQAEVDEQGRNSWKAPVTLSGDFNGEAFSQVVETGPNSVELRSIWVNMYPSHQRIHLASVLAAVHVRTEAGVIPFFSYTGFAGLIKSLQDQQQSGMIHKMKKSIVNQSRNN